MLTMKKSLLTLFSTFGLFSLTFAQYGESLEVRKFTNSEKKFNDWSVTVYAGLPFMQSADLTSFDNGGSDKRVRLGYDFQLGITKSITHAFGLQLLGTYGKTEQGYHNIYQAKTEYQSVSLLGDLNLTSIFRRVDNKSPYRWAIHAFAGAGVIGYKTYGKESGVNKDFNIVTDQPIDQGSVFSQVGASLKYKITRRIDAELKVSYIMSGDDEFDGGGEPAILNSHTGEITGTSLSNGTVINTIEENNSDNIVAAHLGLSLKLGKHKEHLQWFDANHELYPPTPKDSTKAGSDKACIAGDNDQDGVCDDWDKELESPAGCRVDGSGVCLDTDLDGIIDLFDKCPTYPSTNKETGGCPTLQELLDGLNNNTLRANPVVGGITEESRYLPPVEFELDSDKITGESIPTLDNAADLLKKFYKGEAIIVEGHTDAHGKLAYNQDLSERRVKQVIKYLNGKGIDTSKFTPVGKGQAELKYPECNPATKCPDSKNRGNRRVVFKLVK
jgi:OOP family OmpA-OmpF porin